jgi:hypothetical protein
VLAGVTMRWIAAVSFVLPFLACVGHLPHPTYVAQYTSALTEVGYPPPPARVEFIPKQPSSDAVWIDGEWQWQGRRWAWRIGRWVVPPKGARFAPWMMVRGADGTVYYADGAWRDQRHEEVAEPPPLATGRPNISDVVDPEGELEHTGKTIRSSPDSLADGADGGDGGGKALDEAGLRDDASYQDR